MNDTSDTPKYRINIVSKKTGILPVTLRAWERRYQILSPNRAENRYRLYSERDVEVLRWLKTQVDAGISISQAAAELSSNPDTSTLLDRPAAGSVITQTTNGVRQPEKIAEALHNALLNHDEITADRLFDEASQHPVNILLEKIVIPVLVMIGEDWYLGRILVTTEHFASIFLKARLLSIFQRLPIKRSAAHILVGSAPEDLHELGPLMMSILLREAGFWVEFLGPDIPLDDLVEYTAQEQPRMIILSATTQESALELRNFKQKLAVLKKPPIFGFGGAAFGRSPDLIKTTPGTYLGRTLSDSVQTIQQLFRPGRQA